MEIHQSRGDPSPANACTNFENARSSPGIHNNDILPSAQSADFRKASQSGTTQCWQGKWHRALPKNGESRPYSVRFCRLSRNDTPLFRPSRKLTAVLSIKSSDYPRNNHRWHAVCSLIVHQKDWLPGVAGTDPRLGDRFGASITKRGLAPAPFFISGITPVPIHSATAATVHGLGIRDCHYGPRSINLAQRILSPSLASSSARLVE